MLWFIPSCQLSPTQLTASWWNGGENWKSKSERTCGLRWRQPNRESKSCTCKQSETRDLPTSSHGQAGIQVSPGKQHHKATSRATWEDPRNVLPSPTSFFPRFCVLCCEIEYPCCQLGSAVLACLFPASCAPQSSHWWGGMRSRKRS